MNNLPATFVRLVQNIVLGPFWTIPMGVWRRLLRSQLPRPVVGLAALPGVCACAMWLFGLAQRWPLATIGPLARAGLRGYSPLHRLADQLLQISVLLQTVPALDVAVACVTLWLTVTAMTTVFLSPLYLWLAARSQRCSVAAAVGLSTT